MIVFDSIIQFVKINSNPSFPAFKWTTDGCWSRIPAMRFQSFNQVMEHMESFTNLERKTDKYNTGTYRLDRMQAIMEKLGNPQNSYRTVHVAGSKGKGSTASYIASALQAAGFKTGLYTSPHVSDYRERFTINDRFVEDDVLISVAQSLFSSLEGFSFCDSMGENTPTTFELYTAFAFLLFKEEHCTWAVIETGLGGRLDATNIIMPQASVLTPIELEHTDVLGDTITKIAVEKSKIIKPGVPSFSALQDPEALAVFKAEAASKNSAFHYLGDHISDVEDNLISFKDGYSWNCSLAMAGLVQAQNCALALLVIRTLGFYIPSVTEKAMEENRLPGRMELVPWKRPLYLDGAHTKNSMGHLIGTFRKMYPGRTGICIFGAVTGKNHLEMSRQVLQAFDTVVVSKPGTYKASNPEALYELLLSMKGPSQTVVLREDASGALEYCLSHSKPGEPVLCAGSFYLAGEIKEALCL